MPSRSGRPRSRSTSSGRRSAPTTTASSPVARLEHVEVAAAQARPQRAPSAGSSSIEQDRGHGRHGPPAETSTRTSRRRRAIVLVAHDPPCAHDELTARFARPSPVPARAGHVDALPNSSKMPSASAGSSGRERRARLDLAPPGSCLPEPACEPQRVLGRAGLLRHVTRPTGERRRTRARSGDGSQPQLVQGTSATTSRTARSARSSGHGTAMPGRSPPAPTTDRTTPPRSPAFVRRGELVQGGGYYRGRRRRLADPHRVMERHAWTVVVGPDQGTASNCSSGVVRLGDLVRGGRERRRSDDSSSRGTDTPGNSSPARATEAPTTRSAACRASSVTSCTAVGRRRQPNARRVVERTRLEDRRQPQPRHRRQHAQGVSCLSRDLLQAAVGEREVTHDRSPSRGTAAPGRSSPAPNNGDRRQRAQRRVVQVDDLVPGRRELRHPTRS